MYVLTISQGAGIFVTYQAGGPMYGDTLLCQVEPVGRAHGVLGQVLVVLAGVTCSNRDDFLTSSACDADSLSSKRLQINGFCRLINFIAQKLLLLYILRSFLTIDLTPHFDFSNLQIVFLKTILGGFTVFHCETTLDMH